MRLIGLELCDVGITAAGKDPSELLNVEEENLGSPGYALSEKRRLLLGRSAERISRLYPRQVVNNFWDQLGIEPLKYPSPHAQNYAELAYAHLSLVWEHLKKHGDGLIIAVPEYFSRDQMGIILGIARELSIPVKGLVSMAVAASTQSYPGSLLLYLDIHLHRCVINFLKQDEQLTLNDTQTSPGKGFDYLYTEWMKIIAGEFVRSTRFDPFHHALSEQEMYNRIPSLLSQLQQQSSAIFEIEAGFKTHRVTLSREMFAQRNEILLQEIRRLILTVCGNHGKPGQSITLQTTHRVTSLPGLKEMLAAMPEVRVIELKPGAGALGALYLWREFSNSLSSQNILLLTSRPWQKYKPITTTPQSESVYIPASHMSPTHILYHNLAYPITKKPLFIGRDDGPEEIAVRIKGNVAGISRKHCSIQRRNEDIVLVDYSTYGTFVDDIRVSATTILKFGQVIRLGTPGEKLQLIACVNQDETETN